MLRVAPVLPGVLEARDVQTLSLEDKARVLIYYADYNAYPEWLWTR